MRKQYLIVNTIQDTNGNTVRYEDAKIMDYDKKLHDILLEVNDRLEHLHINNVRVFALTTDSLVIDRTKLKKPVFQDELELTYDTFSEK